MNGNKGKKPLKKTNLPSRRKPTTSTQKNNLPTINSQSEKRSLSKDIRFKNMYKTIETTNKS